MIRVFWTLQIGVIDDAGADVNGETMKLVMGNCKMEINFGLATDYSYLDLDLSTLNVCYNNTFTQEMRKSLIITS
jgi:hypothetical protein